jgi:predicted AAA+ superfamily ATPase
MLIERSAKPQLLYYLQHFPAVVLLGPRQVGKTTLAKSIADQAERPLVYLDLERPSDIEKLQHPEIYLTPLKDSCVVIDEVQRMPKLFEALRPLIDEHRQPGRFVLLGSASPSVIKGASETLSGRVAYLELPPLSLPEIEPHFDWRAHWFRGGFPEVLLTTDNELAQERLSQFIRTFAERELGSLGQDVTPATLMRLWQMLAHYHGQTMNVQELSNALDITGRKVSRYLDLLEGGFMTRRLQPWYVNIGKRLVKTPKIYLRDSGMLHTLLRLTTPDAVIGHPGCGSSWEGYVIEQIMRTAGHRWEYNFYRTQQGAEIDLLLTSPTGKRAAVEIKFSSAPSVSKGFYISLEDLKPDFAYIVSPETETYPKPGGVTACSLSFFLKNELDKIA